MTFHEITQLNDLLLLPFLDMIQREFPADEQMPASFFLRLLHDKAAGLPEAVAHPFYAILDEQGVYCGLLMFELLTKEQTVYLWYIAVDSTRRSQGLGSQIYRWMCQQAQKEMPDMKAIVFEVERPDQAHDPEEAAFHEKRIAFYRRNGAKVAVNVRYFQSVSEWQKPKLMYLCIHPFNDVSLSEMNSLLTNIFGKSMEPVEELELE